jgi:hypothetical protein
MSKIDELTADEIRAAREQHLWDRKYDARDGVGMALRMTLNGNVDRTTGKVNRVTATYVMSAILGAVVPERRLLLVDTMIDLFERWYAVNAATPDDRTATVAAHRPFMNVVRDAADAQIAGIVSLFGGGSR